MPTIMSIPKRGASVKVPEYAVGTATSDIVYPGIAQCITVTGWHPTYLVGAHISPGADADFRETTLGYLEKLGGKHILFWYVVGNFREFFTHTRVGSKTAIEGHARKEWAQASDVVDALRKEMDKQAVYTVADTTVIADKVDGYGIDIRATHAPSGVEFEYAAYAEAGAEFQYIPCAYIRV